jgi:cyclic pyranopterin phosphate synthase
MAPHKDWTPPPPLDIFPPAPMPSSSFSHLDAKGTARMVDVGGKPAQRRMAVAEGFVECAPGTVQALRDQSLPKGDVLTVARIAAIQAAKRTDGLARRTQSEKDCAAVGDFS